jgi:hypothetical protein
MTSKTTAAMIRSKLNLQSTPNNWQVFSTKDGGETFHWFIVSSDIAMWYFNQFQEIRTRMSDSDLVRMLGLLEAKKAKSIGS